ncbi:unnamed protein product [Lymnaea stagnalis]|uniref:Transmembrane protein 186 n=1 Tax=Lymnaea stagnalis TaxID=6523 RepID=A0AAV2I2R4_LYMST
MFRLQSLYLCKSLKFGNELLRCAISVKEIPVRHFSSTKCQGILSLRQTKLFQPRNEKDKVPQDFVLIYENSLKNVIDPCRAVSTSMCFVTFGVASIYMLTNQENLQPWEIYTISGMCLFPLIILFFVNIISRYYLLRIYSNKDMTKFIGIYRSLMGLIRQIQYSPSDLKPIQSTNKNISTYIKSNVLIKGRRLHLRATDFVMPKYYNLHTGFDQVLKKKKNND